MRLAPLSLGCRREFHGLENSGEFLFSGFLGQDEAGRVTEALLPSCSRGFVGFVVPAVFCASKLSRED